jgi:hypothetical protein
MQKDANIIPNLSSQRKGVFLKKLRPENRAAMLPI